MASPRHHTCNVSVYSLRHVLCPQPEIEDMFHDCFVSAAHVEFSQIYSSACQDKGMTYAQAVLQSQSCLYLRVYHTKCCVSSCIMLPKSKT